LRNRIPKSVGPIKARIIKAFLRPDHAIITTSSHKRVLVYFNIDFLTWEGRSRALSHYTLIYFIPAMAVSIAV
jgi:hypothetical protein